MQVSFIREYVLTGCEVLEPPFLGPPKTAFASAGARNATKATEPSTRSSYTVNDDDGTKNERQNFRDRYNKDGARNERDGDRNRDNRPENLRSRREDNERWGNTKTPKTPFDDPDRASRRNGDRDLGRDRETGRDAGRGGRGFDNFRRNGDQEGDGEDSKLRRTGQGRGRNEPSWYRDDAEADASEPARDTSRRDWRGRDKGGGHLQDRDLNNGGRPRREPEWMDEPQTGEKKHAHTLDDFQRWKESKKIGQTAPETPASPEPKANHERTLSGKMATASKGKAETPLVLDSQVNDGFFGMWGGPKKENTTSSAEEQPKKALGKPSKFTNFFAPKPEVQDTQESVPATAPLPDIMADPSVQKQRNEDFFKSLLFSGRSNQAPVHDQSRDIPQSPPAQAPPPCTRESLLHSAPPRERLPPRSHDSQTESLLHLLKQNHSNHQSNHQLLSEDHPQPTLRGPPPPGLPFSNLMISPQPNPQQPPSTGPPPGLFDLHNDDKAPQRRPQPPPPGFYDDFSPSIHRPPGLDFNPPPRQQPMPPPPGFPSQIRNPNAYPPGLMPDRGAPFGGRGQGMPPPPGFFHGINAPPGFPPMAFGANGQDSGFGRGPGDFGDFGAQGQGQGGYGR